MVLDLETLPYSSTSSRANDISDMAAAAVELLMILAASTVVSSYIPSATIRSAYIKIAGTSNNKGTYDIYNEPKSRYYSLSQENSNRRNFELNDGMQRKGYAYYQPYRPYKQHYPRPSYVILDGDPLALSSDRTRPKILGATRSWHTEFNHQRDNSPPPRVPSSQPYQSVFSNLIQVIAEPSDRKYYGPFDGKAYLEADRRPPADPYKPDFPKYEVVYPYHSDREPVYHSEKLPEKFPRPFQPNVNFEIKDPPPSDIPRREFGLYPTETIYYRTSGFGENRRDRAKNPCNYIRLNDKGFPEGNELCGRSVSDIILLEEFPSDGQLVMEHRKRYRGTNAGRRSGRTKISMDSVEETKLNRVRRTVNLDNAIEGGQKSAEKMQNEGIPSIGEKQINRLQKRHSADQNNDIVMPIGTAYVHRIFKRTVTNRRAEKSDKLSEIPASRAINHRFTGEGIPYVQRINKRSIGDLKLLSSKIVERFRRSPDFMNQEFSRDYGSYPGISCCGGYGSYSGSGGYGYRPKYGFQSGGEQSGYDYERFNYHPYENHRESGGNRYGYRGQDSQMFYNNEDAESTNNRGLSSFLTNTRQSSYRDSDEENDEVDFGEETRGKNSRNNSSRGNNTRHSQSKTSGGSSGSRRSNSNRDSGGNDHQSRRGNRNYGLSNSNFGEDDRFSGSGSGYNERNGGNNFGYARGNEGGGRRGYGSNVHNMGSGNLGSSGYDRGNGGYGSYQMGGRGSSGYGYE